MLYVFFLEKRVTQIGSMLLLSVSPFLNCFLMPINLRYLRIAQRNSPLHPFQIRFLIVGGFSQSAE